MTYNLFDYTFFNCHKNVHEGPGSGIQWPPESGSIISDHGSVWNSYGSGTLLGVNFLNVCLFRRVKATAWHHCGLDRYGQRRTGIGTWYSLISDLLQENIDKFSIFLT